MYISVPKDVLAVKKKVLFGLDWLQLGICAAGIVPAGWVLASFYSYNTNMAAFLFALVFAPFGFIAFYNKNGQPAYLLIYLFIRQKIRRRPIRLKSYTLPRKLKKGGAKNATNKTKNSKKSANAKIQDKPATNLPARQAGKTKKQ